MKYFEVISNKFHEIRYEFSEPEYKRISVCVKDSLSAAKRFARKHGYLTVREFDCSSGEYKFHEVS